MVLNGFFFENVFCAKWTASKLCAGAVNRDRVNFSAPGLLLLCSSYCPLGAWGHSSSTLGGIHLALWGPGGIHLRPWGAFILPSGGLGAFIFDPGGHFSCPMGAWGHSSSSIVGVVLALWHTYYAIYCILFFFLFIIIACICI